MKAATTILLSMVAITGFLLAGAEAPSIPMQFVTCTVGVCLFAVGMFGIARVNRR